MTHVFTRCLPTLGCALVIGLAACDAPPSNAGDDSDAAGQRTEARAQYPSGEPEPITETHPYERIPVIDAYYEGEKAWFIHTDVSDSAMADRLTRMVGYRTMHVSELAGVPEDVATPRILRSVQEIREAEAAGELTVRPTDVVVNAPVVKWPTGDLGGEARLPGTGTGPEGN